MVESDKGSNTGQIKAARIKCGLGGLCCKCQVLIPAIPIGDRAGLIGIIDGFKSLAGMELRGCW
jgi:hypothetical protein